MGIGNRNGSSFGVDGNRKIYSKTLNYLISYWFISLLGGVEYCFISPHKKSIDIFYVIYVIKRVDLELWILAQSAYSSPLRREIHPCK